MVSLRTLTERLVTDRRVATAAFTVAVLLAHAGTAAAGNCGGLTGP